LRPVSRASPVPLYRQVERDLRGRIESGELQPGHRLPSEAELAQRYDASKITLRQALATLAAEGLIAREPGRGTFIRQPTITAGSRVLTSFTQEVAALGLSAGAEMLRLERIPADERSAEILRVDLGTPVVAVDRLRYGNGSRIGIQRARLVGALVPDLENVDLRDRSLYSFLESTYDIVPAEAEEVFRVASIEEEDAQLLGVPNGTCGFFVERVSYLGDRPFEYVRSTLRGDRYQVRLGLRSQAT
jgi:GntR family transcriptional regulator